ncbi:MAG: adenylate/guanylate cyclase domain-containing protein [Haliangiales bacterium]
MRCPECKHENPAGVKFCGACGTKLPLSCGACGAPNPPGNKFCHECGKPLGSRSETTGAVLSPPRAMARALTGGSARAVTADSARPLAPTPTPLPTLTGERRHATVVFSDVAGYTAMNQRLDPEEVEALVGRIKDAAVAIVERYGGMVNQFVGDEVLALFGIPIAHEDDPLRAVRAAIALHEAVCGMSAAVEGRIGQPLRMHTGIHTGLVVTNRRDDRDGRFGVIGSTVNLSARLRELAGGDEILISPETERLVAPFCETQALEPLVLKGTQSAIVPHRVLSASATRSRFEVAAERGLVRYVGRARELIALEASLTRARAGQGQLTYVIGEAGIGKSRLVYELRRRADSDAVRGRARGPVRVLEGACRAFAEASIYGPFLELLRQLLGVGSQSRGDAAFATCRRALEDIDPALSAHLLIYLHLLSLTDETDELPDYLRGEALKNAAEVALCRLLLATARQRPLLLILEDWQWADEASDAALSYLAEHLAEASISVVVTRRPERARARAEADPEDRDPVAASTPAGVAAQRIALGPLDRAQSRDVMAAIIEAKSLPEELVALVHERTGGNPLFVEALCRSLREEEAVRVSRGLAVLSRPIDSLALPDTVQAILRTRLDRLQPTMRELLRFASVIGKRFEVRVLAALFDNASWLQTWLDELASADMIEAVRQGREPAYSFRQALTCEVAYETLRLAQRKTLHARVGEIIEQLYEGSAEDLSERLSYHFSRAEDWPRAVRYGRRSAERAASLSQFKRALAVLDQVEGWSERLGDADERFKALVEVLFRKEQVYETMSRRDDQQAIIERLFELCDRDRDPDGAQRAAVFVRQGDLLTLRGRYQDAEQALGQALEIRQRLGEAVGQAHVLRSMGYLRWHQGRYAEAAALNEAALAIDRERDDDGAVATDLSNLGAVWRHAGEHERARACFEEARGLYEGAGSPNRQGFMIYSLANLERSLGKHELALGQYQRAYEIFRTHHHQVLASRALAGVAAIHWERGEVSAGLRLTEEVVQLSREISYGQGLAHSLRTLGERFIGLARAEDAVTHLAESCAIFHDLGEHRSEAEVWQLLATLYERELEAPQKAMDAWEQVSALRLLVGERSAALAALEEMARVARDRLRDDDAAERHLTAVATMASELGELDKLGQTQNSLGILAWRRGDFERALECYQAARDCYRELGAVGHEGFILNSLGVTLHKLGRSDDAVEHLEAALRHHRRAGQALFEGHALAALGDIWHARGDFDQAVRNYRESLAIRETIGDRRGEGWMHHALAKVCSARGDADEAGRHAGMARVIAAEENDEALRHALDKT